MEFDSRLLELVEYVERIEEVADSYSFEGYATGSSLTLSNILAPATRLFADSNIRSSSGGSPATARKIIAAIANITQSAMIEISQAPNFQFWIGNPPESMEKLNLLISALRGAYSPASQFIYSSSIEDDGNYVISRLLNNITPRPIDDFLTMVYALKDGSPARTVQLWHYAKPCYTFVTNGSVHHTFDRKGGSVAFVTTVEVGVNTTVLTLPPISIGPVRDVRFINFQVNPQHATSVSIDGRTFVPGMVYDAVSFNAMNSVQMTLTPITQAIPVNFQILSIKYDGLFVYGSYGVVRELRSVEYSLNYSAISYFYTELSLASPNNRNEVLNIMNSAWNNHKAKFAIMYTNFASLPGITSINRAVIADEHAFIAALDSIKAPVGVESIDVTSVRNNVFRWFSYMFTMGVLMCRSRMVLG